ncbi:four-carbon acid sugar kinase family protein [Prosthecodimorpha staleyi]|uniref:Four-carbon acid sugar kinase family protein n=1 Tax=Prosthecodimorpha staleyi TaxID=2840188 RepID=A0A947GJJ0_9HYPH|nr:four-carbon acid sugar kinase family protein [Prosthecodimorpha staleyi]MBT9291754.1 four-carbon acid sugar kinase family protein [Prosthecodimorpha staleyi]
MTDEARSAGNPRVGWYGDDFTGASDTLATWAERGFRAVLLTRIPEPERLAALGPLDAVGLAGATRSLDPIAMARELDPAGRFFAGLGVDVLHYKCCSTFDSAPQVGSIGAAVSALRPHFPHPNLPIVGGQPNLGRYCLFGQLFATAGASGEAYRIDRHPTMSRHPVTPMDEADLRRHLARQGLGRLGLVDYPTYALPSAEAVDRVAALAATHPDLLFDVSREQDLATIGEVLWNWAGRAPLVAVGASSVARALAAAWPAAWAGTRGAPMFNPPMLSPPIPGPSAAAGPVFVLVGSLSPVTRAQTAQATRYETVALDVARLIAEAAYRDAQAARIAQGLAAGRHMLAATALPEAEAAEAGAGAAEVGTDPQPRLGALQVAEATARLAAAVLNRIRPARTCIAGGDTSSLAIQALGLWGLSHIATLGPGAALCRTHADRADMDGLEIMLKGGQMGQPTLFDDLAGGG